MGLYVEPVGSKKDWFVKNAQLVGVNINPNAVDWKGATLPIAYMDNGPFQAIAVLWDKKEFLRVTCGRPDAITAVVAKSVLQEVVPGGHKLKELK